jgi:hypothetical protein
VETRRIEIGGRRRWALAAGLALALAIVVQVLDNTGSARAAVTGIKLGAPLGHGSWSSGCNFVKRAADDPIVYPRKPGAAHSHDFFGNPSTNAYSTRTSLLNRAGACNVAADRSAYWIPTLLARNADGSKTPIPAPLIKVYYRGAGREPSTIKPFPKGFRVITGDQHSTGAQEGIEFWCSVGGATAPSSPHPPNCAPGEYLSARVTFPDCSDGRADSPDHKSHVAFAERYEAHVLRQCPASHPVAIPQLSLLVVYSGTAGKTLEWASGGLHSLHADFFEAWTGTAVKQLIAECIAKSIICERPKVTG